MPVVLPLAHKTFSHSRYSAYKMSSIVVLHLALPFLVVILCVFVGIIKLEFIPTLAMCGLDGSRSSVNTMFLIFDAPKLLVQLICYTLMINQVTHLQGSDRRKVCGALKVVLCSACWMPYYVQFMLQRVRTPQFSETQHVWLPIICVQGIILNSAIIIYYVSVPAFKKCITDPL